MSLLNTLCILMVVVVVGCHSQEVDSFTYGLDVPQPARDQYQHKEKRVDDVTYGCFGHVDPEGKSHTTVYISGSFGYRPLKLDGKTMTYPDIDPKWENFPKECNESEEKNS